MDIDKRFIDKLSDFIQYQYNEYIDELKLFTKKKYPNAEYLSNNGFYLPSGLGIKNYEIDYICKIVNRIIR